MTKHDWDKLPRRRQREVLRHMQVATVAAWRLDYDQMERVLNGYFEAIEECRPRARCVACRFGWTKASRPSTDEHRAVVSPSPEPDK